LPLKLVGRLGELSPGSAHVFNTGLARSTPDKKTWEYAAAEFLDLAESHGAPPKVVLLENCDYRTSQVESLLTKTCRLD